MTHHEQGAAGLYGLEIHYAPIHPTNYTIDVVGLEKLVAQVRPKLVTIGACLNLFPHPVREVADIAHAHGAKVLYDAAHVSGLLAGRVWPDPLGLGADMLSMSTYKSLGGPAGGLLFTNDETLTARVDSIAHQGLTANFDVGVTASLALGLLDWLEFGSDYAQAMIRNASALAGALIHDGLPVFTTPQGPRHHISWPFAPTRGAAAPPRLAGSARPTCSPPASACPRGKEYDWAPARPRAGAWGCGDERTGNTDCRCAWRRPSGGRPALDRAEAAPPHRSLRARLRQGGPSERRQDRRRRRGSRRP